jgi:CRISPR-associated protein (Cas_csx3)
MDALEIHQDRKQINGAMARGVSGKCYQLPVSAFRRLPHECCVVMSANREILIDLRGLYRETAKLAESPDYLEKAQALAAEGNVVILTGQAPVWLYLQIAHGLHGKARKLLYRTPSLDNDVLIFNHDAY